MNLLLSFRVTSKVTFATNVNDVVYPRSIHNESADQFQVLKETLKSYNTFHFKRAYIAIDITDNTAAETKLIQQLITANIRATKLIISYDRPTTKQNWLNFLHGIHDPNEPYLVSMNHDQLLVGSADGFSRLVGKYQNHIAETGTVLAFTHIPEYVATAKLDLFGYNFSKDGLCYIDLGPRKWLDGVFVMSIQTLTYLFENIAANEPEYLPRFDWPGVTFNWVKIKTLVFPIEFFRHYDGSTHVVCSRLLERLQYQTHSASDTQDNDLFLKFVQLYYIYWAKFMAQSQWSILRRQKFSAVYSVCAREYLDAQVAIQPTPPTDQKQDRFHRLAKYYEDICFIDSYLDGRLIDKRKLPRAFQRCRKLLKRYLR